jgi:hypothetical protein
VTDRLIRLTTALAVVAGAGVAAVISYQHAYELVRSRGESGTTAGASSLAAGIVATIDANLAHGLGHGPVGVLVSAWPAVALVGSSELLMLLISPALSVSPRPQRTCQCRWRARVCHRRVRSWSRRYEPAHCGPQPGNSPRTQH